MSSVNTVILLGNLGKDPELSYTSNGTAKCRFTLATSEKFKRDNEFQERTEWHNIVVWGKQAENVSKFLAKGRQAYVEGRIQTRSWDDEKTGQKRHITEINAKRVVFLGANQNSGYGDDRQPDDHGGNGGFDEDGSPGF